MDGELLVVGFARNLRIVQAQTAGVTHGESLAQTPYNINCLNWVVGHIVQSRDVVLRLLGADPVMTPEQFDRYERESDPVTGDGPDVLPLESLLEMIEQQQGVIDEVLGSMTPDQLAAPVPFGDTEMTLFRRIHFQYFHDTYHTGQTDLLRQVSGKSDKVI